jgi:diguanylate cyclase (GGDEF)-like protein
MLRIRMDDDILLVDDDPGTIRVLATILADVGNLSFAISGEDALRMARESAPDLILLDAEMPGMSGFLVCEALKADSELAHVPVIFVTSHRESTFEVSGFELGAADFIAKPLNPPLVLARVKAQLRVKRLADESRRLAMTDGLTGVANRRRFDESLDREWNSARRAGDALALLMIDVDHFKAFNDLYGHPAGDTCLLSLARAMTSACVRPADLVARYGGEEFAVLLPKTSQFGAEHVAHAVLEAVDALAIAHAGSATAAHVTVSIGVASCDADSARWMPVSVDLRLVDRASARCFSKDLVHAADKALYAAKKAGRARASAHAVDDLDAATPARVIARRPPARARGSDEEAGVANPSPAARMADAACSSTEIGHAQERE